jgi:hypothetical protein
MMDLNYNVTYMGADEDGMPLPAVRADDGRYHVVGCLLASAHSDKKKEWTSVAASWGQREGRSLFLCAQSPSMSLAGAV